MDIQKTIAWNAILIHKEFSIQIKIAAYVILDFMMMEKICFANFVTIPGSIINL